jgi:hypothetical protein
MFTKAASYHKILFHKEGDIYEAIVKLNANSLYIITMALITIPTWKPMRFNDSKKGSVIDSSTDHKNRIRWYYNQPLKRG